MSRVLSLRSRRGPYHRHKVPSFTVPVYGHGACLCSRAMFERVQCVKTRILRRSEVVTCSYYTGDGSRTTIADVRPLDRTSSTCVYKIVIFWSTYVWTHPGLKGGSGPASGTYDPLNEGPPSHCTKSGVAHSRHAERVAAKIALRMTCSDF